MAKGIDNCIKFKLHHSTASELLGVYSCCLTSFKYDDEVEEILTEHIKDMCLRLENICNTMINSAQLTLNNTEAICFFKVWNLIDTSAWPLADVLLRDMVQKIDKKRKAPKNYQHGR